MSAEVATHKDTGVVPEAELARRKRDVRGRSAATSSDAERMDEEAIKSGDAHSKSLFISELIEKFIRKKGSQWCVVSKKGKNLGCSSSKGGAAKRLAQVEWFKRHKSLTDEQAADGLDSGALQVGDTVLKSWLDLEEKRAEFKTAVGKHFPSAPCPKCGSTAIDEHVGRGTHKCKECGTEYMPQEEKHLPGVHDQSSHAGGNQTALGGASTKLLAEKVLGEGTMPIGIDTYYWKKRGGYADAKFKAVKAKLEKLGFKEGEYSEGVSQADSGTVSKRRAWVHPDGYEVSFNATYGEVKDSNSFSIWLRGPKAEKSSMVKHLPGQHDQASHAGAGGAAGKVAHTSAQLRDAAARQHAKDEGISITAAKKKVGSGAKVPTTRILKPSRFNKWPSYDLGIHIDILKQRYNAGEKTVSDELKEATASYEWRTKSLIAKADQTCLKSIWGQYYKYYSGKWIAAAWGLYQKGKFGQAAQAFAKARDGVQPDKNPDEYKCLDAWSKDAEGKGRGEQKAGTSEGSKKGHVRRGHKEGGGGKDVERRNDLKLARRQMEQRGREYDAANAQLESAKAKGVAGEELSKLFEEAKASWEAYADARKGFSSTKYSKTLVTKAEMAERNPVRFVAPMIEVGWRITKARITPEGVMEWQGTTTKFDWDVQSDFVEKAFYLEAIRRFKSKIAHPPFVSVAHYRDAPLCLECGYVYKSLAEFACPACKVDRLLAGICTDMWIDGRQPKARGIFYANELGRAAFASVQQDIQKSLPVEDRIRQSMGFYPDVPDGIIYVPRGRRFKSGWVEHFALTRVPVVAETDIMARMVH